MSDMSLGLPFWLRTYKCCGLTTAHMRLPIYQLRFDSLLILDKLELYIILSSCRLSKLCDLAKLVIMF
ncbi:Dihydroorotase [Gossypium arboreum]|uniref:Dihydroorotase n=1 Tax=Gossypium arboreum TaxID=29729 RepID=A0A0B0PVE1_GOSAR|nr:Dihydroorotase [Gossypium arboreum]